MDIYYFCIDNILLYTFVYLEEFEIKNWTETELNFKH